jgi:hypothetical protein
MLNVLPHDMSANLPLAAKSIRRLDRVIVAGSRESTTVEIPWHSRQELLERLRADGDADAIIAAFEAVDTTSPVKLTREQKRRLLSTCKEWLFETRTAGAP